MRNVYIIDTLTSVEICEIVIYRKNFKTSHFMKHVEKFFNSKQKYKDENKDSLQGLVKLVVNSLYAVQIREDINESFYCNSETWMKTEFVLDQWKLSNGNYIVKVNKDDGLDNDCDYKNTLPLHFGVFIFSTSKRILNKFIRKIDGFYTNNFYYSDTDSL